MAELALFARNALLAVPSWQNHQTLGAPQVDAEQRARLTPGDVELVHAGTGECDVRGRQVATRITSHHFTLGTDNLNLTHPVMGDEQVSLSIECNPVGLIVDLAGALLG